MQAASIRVHRRLVFLVPVPLPIPLAPRSGFRQIAPQSERLQLQHRLVAVVSLVRHQTSWTSALRTTRLDAPITLLLGHGTGAVVSRPSSGSVAPRLVRIRRHRHQPLPVSRSGNPASFARLSSRDGSDPSFSFVIFSASGSLGIHPLRRCSSFSACACGRTGSVSSRVGVSTGPDAVHANPLTWGLIVFARVPAHAMLRIAWCGRPPASSQSGSRIVFPFNQSRFRHCFSTQVNGLGLVRLQQESSPQRPSATRSNDSAAPPPGRIPERLAGSLRSIRHPPGDGSCSEFSPGEVPHQQGSAESTGPGRRLGRPNRFIHA